MPRLQRSAAGCIAILLIAAPAVRADDWTHLGGSPARNAVTLGGPMDFAQTRWIVPPSADDEAVGPSSSVVFNGTVYVNTRHFEDGLHVENRLIAYDTETGAERWAASVDPDFFDSWSSPAVDAANNVVLIPTGYMLFALDAATGAALWDTKLDRYVVNASPAVSSGLLANGTPANRAFITDFGLFEASLYAINVDPFHPTDNPYQPGDCVWWAPLPGSSGNTPAYRAGVVYVASIVEAGIGGGDVFAFDAQAGGDPLWTFHTDSGGFFGGVVVKDGFVYAATYVFDGGRNNSSLFKISATTGEPAWETPTACERTSSIPIIVGDGRIYLSGGIEGFGSHVTIQNFFDLGPFAVIMWDTYSTSGGTLLAGGWSHQPVFSCNRLYAGTLNDALGLSQYSDLRVFDLSRVPGDPDFVIDHEPGAGASPAVTPNRIYSFGPDGLFAIKGSGAVCDVPNEDGDPGPGPAGS